ncbi:GMC family oxidoreductase [Pedobacter psychrophilus]|uniref:GMC family oxidoreductase n=1 Tax=Pedobacter psychrophilus TaxID=1826909 RepID=A0A179DDS8_9SPHI|nr:GMC family oxidoreductase [Pedobacter psychrophilus]OAQ38962.1 GMC family oxidoreductase [Pedobacter psychrophilus]
MEEIFDAIVIGSGITGGWAAKELTEKGLKTIMIEYGRNVEHIKDYPTTNMYPWEFSHRGSVPYNIAKEYQSVNTHYIFGESTLHFLKKDSEQEYIQEKPFAWIRGKQIGGRSLLWARQTQRWSDFDFEGPLKDGFAVDWPIRYKDIAPWYSYVEKFVGISGNKDGLETLPDGEFLPPFELTCLDQHFQDYLKKEYTDRHLISSRVANLSTPNPIHLEQGRGQCQRRNLCERGCPFGGYFSSNSSTIPWAQKTGNLSIMPNTVVQSIIYDDDQKKAIGVKVIDVFTKDVRTISAKIIFLNASAMNSNLILLNSKSDRFPKGLANDNGLLGKYIAFHNYRGKVTAEFDELKDTNIEGRRPNAAFIPRFVNVYKQEKDFIRGYNTLINSSRMNLIEEGLFGDDLKEKLLNPKLGNWVITANMMGETIPKETSTITLDPVKKDKYGIPQARFSVDFDENDEKMLKDFFKEFSDMFTKAGYSNIKTIDTKRVPGHENHEMGGVRMGRDPNTSLLNEWNQLHLCKNVYVTDGACMTSTASQNPSLTYMALTARAANHAINDFKSKNVF